MDPLHDRELARFLHQLGARPKHCDGHVAVFEVEIPLVLLERGWNRWMPCASVLMEAGERDGQLMLSLSNDPPAW